MTAGTKERMTQTFDAMADGFRTSFEAAKKAQNSWFDNMNEMFRNPAEFGGFFSNTGQFTKEWMPLMAENTRLAADCLNTNVRESVGVFKTFCEKGAKADNGDFYQNTRDMWDATFDAMRTNFDAFGKVTKSTMENCSNFIKSTCCEVEGTKPAPKQSK